MVPPWCLVRDEPTDEERDAAAAVRAATRWVLTYADSDTDGRADWRATTGGAFVGSVEVTIRTDPVAKQTSESVGDHRWPVPGSRLAWDVRYRTGVQMTDLRRHLPEAVRLCERAGVDHLEDLSDATRAESVAVAWFEHERVTLTAMRGAGHSGVVFVLPGPWPGWPGDDGASQVVRWVEEIVGGDVAAKVERMRPSMASATCSSWRSRRGCRSRCCPPSSMK